MSKRVNSASTPASTKAQALTGTNGRTPEKPRVANGSMDSDVEMGEFEDAWEDAIESESELAVAASDSDSDAMAMDEDIDNDTNDQGDSEAMEAETKVYLPGQALGEDEQLEVDNKAYVMLHSLQLRWPCLSFDFVPDPAGINSVAFPMTLYAVAGTQADSPGKNEVVFMKMSQLHRTQNDDDDGDGDDGAVNDDDTLDDDPILETKIVNHQGGVNRVRVSDWQGKPVVATWADTGKVHIWDASAPTKALATPGYQMPAAVRRPLHTVTSHGRNEGFALDWSAEGGHLLTGDINSDIYLTQRNAQSGAFVADRTPFSGHTSSVEDLQWSPSEKSVFASASADQTVRIWDCRQKKRSALNVHAHTSDVNVITWNTKTAYLLASGADDGVFSIWDLRTFSSNQQAKPIPVATFKWHQSPITSIEWSPHEESVLSVSGADDQATLWDLSVELDPEEMQAMNDAAQTEVPPQLLFIHQGQSDIKEVHWHPQRPGVLMSTASTGFNVYKTISV
ncbi:Ribosome assembly protein rrb1 [Dimargaris xerosporica]|nr:Ribosome assembly protein rrb1 [Dimargaris xerosporica]